MALIKYSKGKIEYEGFNEVPSTAKKFRQSEMLSVLYQFIYENNIRREFFKILNKLYKQKKFKKTK